MWWPIVSGRTTLAPKTLMFVGGDDYVEVSKGAEDIETEEAVLDYCYRSSGHIPE